MSSNTSTATTDNDRTFDQFLDFLSHLDEQTLVRLIVDPDEPLRGQDSYEASVQSIHPIDEDGDRLDTDDPDEDKVATRYVFSSQQLFEGDLPDNYIEETIEYRFTVPDTNTLNKTDIELEKNLNTDDWDTRSWNPAGYLIGGGVLMYFD